MSNMATKEKKQQPISVDEQFLKDFYEKGGKATDLSSGKEVTDVDALLDSVADSGSGSTPKQEELHKKAVARGAADTSKEDADKAQREAARIARLQEQEQAKRRGKAGKVYSAVSKGVQGNITDPLISKAGTAVDKVSSLQTLGGIGLLLAILIFLLFVVVQVNAAGDTRIKQFWYMLNGRAHLVGRHQISTGSSTTGIPGTVNADGTVNGPDGKPITLKSIGAADTQAIQNPQGPFALWIESEYRSLFG
jgi:hypothetical protein